MDNTLDQLEKFTVTTFGRVLRGTQFSNVFIHFHKEDVELLSTFLVDNIEEFYDVSDMRNRIYYHASVDESTAKMVKLCFKFPSKKTEIYVRVWGLEERDLFPLLENTVKTFPNLGILSVADRIFINKGYNGYLSEKMIQENHRNPCYAPLDGFSALYIKRSPSWYGTVLDPCCYGPNTVFAMFLNLKNRTVKSCKDSVCNRMERDGVLKTQDISVHPSLRAVFGKHMHVVVIVSKVIEYSPEKYHFSSQVLTKEFVYVVTLPGGQRSLGQSAYQTAADWTDLQIGHNYEGSSFHDTILLPESVIVQVEGETQNRKWVSKRHTSKKRKYYKR